MHLEKKFWFDVMKSQRVNQVIHFATVIHSVHNFTNNPSIHVASSHFFLLFRSQQPYQKKTAIIFRIYSSALTLFRLFINQEFHTVRENCSKFCEHTLLDCSNMLFFFARWETSQMN